MVYQNQEMRINARTYSSSVLHKNNHEEGKQKLMHRFCDGDVIECSSDRKSRIEGCIKMIGYLPDSRCKQTSDWIIYVLSGLQTLSRAF